MWHKWQSATLINKIVGLLPTDSNNMHGTNNRNEQTKCDLGSGRKKKRKTNLFAVCCLVFTVCRLLANRTMSAFFIMCQNGNGKGKGNCCVEFGIIFSRRHLSGQPSKCNYSADSIF